MKWLLVAAYEINIIIYASRRKRNKMIILVEKYVVTRTILFHRLTTIPRGCFSVSTTELSSRDIESSQRFPDKLEKIFPARLFPITIIYFR